MLVLLPLVQPGAGTGNLLPSKTPAVRETISGVAGVATGVGQLTTKDDVVSFIRSHTEQAQATPAYTTPSSEPAPVAVTGGTRGFSFDVDTTTFKPDEYIVTASAVTEDVTGTALFNVLTFRSVQQEYVTGTPGARPTGTSGFYISIDPISDKVVGDRFSITGTTNLPADAEILVQVYSSSFTPTEKSQSGEFSGATGTIRTSSYSPPLPVATPVPTALMTIVPTTGASVTGGQYSKTNVQVNGVDEADIIKTDGTNIYVITGNCLQIINAYPATQAKILSTLRFSGYPSALYVSGDRVVLIATDFWTRPITPCRPGACYGSSPSTERTLVYVFSVRDPENPVLVREVDIDGGYTSSRMIGTQLYFVTNTPIPYQPDDLELPTIHDDHGGISTPPVYGFNTTDQTFAFSTIGSLDVAGTSPVPATSFIVGSAGTLYVSPTRLYVAVPDHAVDGIPRTTTIHAFAIDNGKITYAAGGKVDGTLLSQYSLDEYDGNLRVATTITTSSWQLNGGSYSKVTVLDGNLAVIGALPDIAPGERLYAARFMGDRLYLVTFRKTDPFFVIGLAEPKHPVILGKLQLPGFSDYLHPYDANHIIGIGKESPSGPLKMALFNVTDVNNPVVVDTQSLGGAYSTSPVLDDPKALLFDKEKDLLVLPVQLQGEYSCAPGGSCTPPTTWGGAYVYGVNPATGFVLKGTVRHYSSSYSPSGSDVRRALYIENTLYTMSDAKIIMSDLSDSLVQINEIDFR
jgi:uncharacterized secreted protein with C-terminal beta-propeller domain